MLWQHLEKQAVLWEGPGKRFRYLVKKKTYFTFPSKESQFFSCRYNLPLKIYAYEYTELRTNENR